MLKIVAVEGNNFTSKVIKSARKSQRGLGKGKTFPPTSDDPYASSSRELINGVRNSKGKTELNDIFEVDTGHIHTTT